jgi:murein DD-endopeptidase MepM/ murein hydrolase activator NlpD
MGNVAAGGTGELKDFKTSDNPLNPFYKINQSEESLTQDSEKGLLKGAEKAAKALEELNKFLEKTPDLVLQLNGALQTFNGTKSGSGFMGTVKNVLSTGAHAFAAWKTMGFLKNLKAGVTPAATEGAKQAAKTVATRTAATTVASSAVTATGTTAATAAGLAAVPVTAGAALLYGQHKYYQQGQANLTEMERIAAAQANGWKNPDGTPFLTGPKETFMSAAPEKSWWQKTKDWWGRNVPGLDGMTDGQGVVQGGPTSGFFSNVGNKSSGVNSFTFSSGSQPMANGPLASSMGATSISKVMGAGFGAKDSSLTMSGALNYHTGQDTPMAVGTPVYARFAGKVVERNLSRDLGIAVEIDHGDGYSSIYGHLNMKVVRSGEEVKVGTLIGKSGATGRVTGPHLHFELRKGKVPTDPNKYVPGKKEEGTASSSSGASVSAANVSKGVSASGKQLHAWLMSQGFSSNGATGILGNLIQESGLRTGAIGDNGTSFGIAQWHKGRGDNLKKFAAAMGLSYTDLEAQKLFLLKEMKTYPDMVKRLQDPNIGIVDAAALFMRKFERPKDQSDAAAAKRASLGIGAMQGGPTDGFNTNVNSATPGTDMSSTSLGGVELQQGGTNNVYVTLQIQQANQQEAEAFAKTLKKYLEKDNKLQKIGSN